MKYPNCIPARFLSRPNRFLANVLIGEREETVHVKNTGRCRELLCPGAKVYLVKSSREGRKTKYDLVAVEKIREGKPNLLVNMDSQAPCEVVAEYLPKSGLFSPNARFYRERTHLSSRFDFYIEDGNRRAFLEVKGVTLEKEGRALFPDAPTLRGIKHVKELVKAVEEGYESYLLFLIQMKEMSSFSPNDETHKAFGEELRRAKEKGVKILAVDCKVLPGQITASLPVPVILDFPVLGKMEKNSISS